MNYKKFQAGDKVKYISETFEELKGSIGIIVERKGDFWVVEFPNQRYPTYSCFDYSLEKVEPEMSDRNKTTASYVTEKEQNWIWDEAKRLKVSVSDYIRNLIAKDYQSKQTTQEIPFSDVKVD